MAIAIHSTALGPALGGARLWRYLRDEDGVADALRLARGMTFKAAAAGLDLGGGKGVICAPSTEPPTGAEREALLLDFGDLVESLGGRYITAEDVGTTPEDMVVISSRTRHVTGMPAEHGGAGDPSPFTALGVQAAMRAACAVRVRHAGPGRAAGRRRRARARRREARPRAARMRGQADRLRHRPATSARSPRRSAPVGLEPETALEADCDIVAPCAVGGAINADNVGRAALPRSSAARRTTSSPTRRSPRRSPSAASSTRPTSSPTRAG